jgi:hypothetical protein
MIRECLDKFEWPIPVRRNQVQEPMTARMVDLRRLRHKTTCVSVGHEHSVLEPLTPCAALEYNLG